MLENICIGINNESNNINTKLETLYQSILSNNQKISKLKEIKSKLLEKYF